jgi:hypothetical protein
MLRVVDRFHRQRAAHWQAALATGDFAVTFDWDALAPERLRALAGWSLALLAGSAVAFIGLDVGAAYAHGQPLGPLTGWRLAGLIAANVGAYAVVLPLHECVHGLAFTICGGKPSYGAKLPLALYCGAPEQAFRRNAYLLAGLAPFVVITVAGLALTWIRPDIAAYLQFGFIGNAAGAVGDLWAARVLLRQRRDSLIEDTATGFRVYAASPSSARNG